MGLLNRQKNSRTKKNSWLLATGLATLVFFNNCTTAPFEASAVDENPAKHRLPASVVQQNLEFDCSHPSQKLEVTTGLETIRLEAKNCVQKIQFKNEKHPQPLVTFPMGAHKFASEFAYLIKGENAFSIIVGDHIYKVLVHRF